MSARFEGRERNDVEPRRVLTIAALVAGTLLLVLVICRLLYGWLIGPVPPQRAGLQAVPPAPRLQAHPRQALETLRRQKRQVLESYGWVDARAGVARIPIERAMVLSVARAQRAEKERP